MSILTIDIKQVVEKYGFKPNRTGYIACPFHVEKDASLKIYPNGKGWYCFGCCSGGNAINFVMKLYNIDYKTAIAKINEDFGLGNSRLSRFERMKIASEDYQRIQNKKKKDELTEIYWQTLEKWKLLDDIKRIFTPKTSEEELHPLFVYALQKLTYQEYLLDIAEMRLSNHA